MTMPDERTRSLRWGWELLQELKASNTLDDEQRRQLERILGHYPSADEIREWAEQEAARTDGGSWIGPFLAPKDKVEKSIPFDSGPVRPMQSSASERLLAIRAAGEFFKAMRAAGNVSAELKRQIPFVLRHFPGEGEIEHAVQRDQNQTEKEGFL